MSGPQPLTRPAPAGKVQLVAASFACRSVSFGAVLGLVSGCVGGSATTAPVTVAVPAATATAAEAGATSKRYCDFVAFKQTGPVCLGEVSAEAATLRERTFELDVSSGKIVRYRIRNGWGGPGGGPDDSDVALEYDGDLVSSARLHTWSGRQVGRWVYEDGGKRARLVDDAGRPSVRSADLPQLVEVDFDARGFPSSERKYDVNRVPRTGGGCFEERTVHDPQGLTLERACFGPDGAPSAGDGGVFRTTYEYPHGARAEVAHYFGVDQAPLGTDQGCATTRFEFDASGNASRARCEGPRGEHLYTTLIARDAHGTGTEYRVVGPDGRPRMGYDGFATARARYDASGRVTLNEYLDAEGSPAPGKRLERSRWDGRSRLVELASFESSDRRARPVHVERYEYDERDLAVALRYVDADGRTIPGPKGYALLVTVFDERERIVEQSFRDVNGEPTADESGFARVTFEYAPNGVDKQETRWFDLAGKQLDPVGARWITVSWGNVPALGKRPAVKNRSKDEARRRAEQARARVTSGERFEDVARALSDDPATLDVGGDLGVFHVGTRPAIDRTLMDASVGETSPVLETESAFVILLRTE